MQTTEIRRPEPTPDPSETWVERHDVVTELLTEALGKDVARVSFLNSEEGPVLPYQPAIAFAIADSSFVGTWLVDTEMALVIDGKNSPLDYDGLRRLAEQHPGGFKLGAFAITGDKLDMTLADQLNTVGITFSSSQFMVTRHPELIANSPLM